MTELDETHRTITYTGDEQTLTLRRDYPTSADDLWDACTNPERIPRWFLPIEGDLRMGGTYQLEGNAGGTIESCDPPHEFTATWEFGGWVSRIRVAVEPSTDGATFTLAHTGPTGGDHWEQYGPAAVGIGWDGMLHGLVLHVASGGEPVDAEQVAQWAGSPEGLEFTRVSGKHWLTADLAAGTPPDDAERRSAACVRAYTGG